MHLVEGGAALRQLAERWRQRTRWAFTILQSPVESAAKALALPPLPGMHVPQHTELHAQTVIRELWSGQGRGAAQKCVTMLFGAENSAEGPDLYSTILSMPVCS